MVGPASSFYWPYILGIMGPKRIVVDDPNYNQTCPPYDLVNNEFSILGGSRCVMMDRLGTDKCPSREFGQVRFLGSRFRIFVAWSCYLLSVLKNINRLNLPNNILVRATGPSEMPGVMNYLLGKWLRFKWVNHWSLLFWSSHFILCRPNEEHCLTGVYLPTEAATSWYYDKVANKERIYQSFFQGIPWFTENEYICRTFSKGYTPRQLSVFLELRVNFRELYWGISEIWGKSRTWNDGRELFQNCFGKEGKTVGRLDSRLFWINKDPMSRIPFYWFLQSEWCPFHLLYTMGS